LLLVGKLVDVLWMSRGCQGGCLDDRSSRLNER
jgi:hypothetical protein